MNSQRLEFDPAFPVQWMLLAVLALVAAYGICRMVFGPAASLTRGRVVLLLPRLVIASVLLLILCGPTLVTELPQITERPDLFLLIDTSRSMQIGRERSRFDRAIATIDDTLGRIPEELRSDLKLFTFGDRHSAVESVDLLSDLEAVAADSRLADALTDLTADLSRSPPAGVVVFSDGQVRDPLDAQQISRELGRQGIRVYSYALAGEEGQGDIALLSVVAPKHVRKYADVEILLFLRSTGYQGETGIVSLSATSENGPAEELDQVPVLLKDGVQAVPLTYHTDSTSRQLKVRFEPMPGELSTENNELSARIEVNRPKIRVLYVEGNRFSFPESIRIEPESIRPTRTSHPPGTLMAALTEDDEIELTLLTLDSSGSRLRPVTGSTRAYVPWFPRTRREMSGFDCIILSNVPANLFQEEQLEWLAEWVELRGGGLLMSAGERSFGGGDWHETPLADVLPVTFETAQLEPIPEGTSLQPTSLGREHSVWRDIDAGRRGSEVSQPRISKHLNKLSPKPAADVLAQLAQVEGRRDPQPTIVAGQFGRGRAIACAFPLSLPDAYSFFKRTGTTDGPDTSRLMRNVVYWLSENAEVGRRRIHARLDKNFYRPGDEMRVRVTAFDQNGEQSVGVHVVGVFEPTDLSTVDDDLTAPLLWPSSVSRTDGENPRVRWGESITIPPDRSSGEFELTWRIPEDAKPGALRLELAAYDSLTTTTANARLQVDSTALEVQILDDPFEFRNPRMNHQFLTDLARESAGFLIESPEELVQLASNLPVRSTPPATSRRPAWNRWSLLLALLGAWTVDWALRRRFGLA